MDPCTCQIIQLGLQLLQVGLTIRLKYSNLFKFSQQTRGSMLLICGCNTTSSMVLGSTFLLQTKRTSAISLTLKPRMRCSQTALHLRSSEYFAGMISQILKFGMCIASSKFNLVQVQAHLVLCCARVVCKVYLSTALHCNS